MSIDRDQQNPRHVSPTLSRPTRVAIEVGTLLGHRDVGMATACLGSLGHACKDPFRIRVHDDGTLTDADRAQLADRLPGSRFVERAPADEAVHDLLARYPACRAFRTRQIYGLKLFDVPLLSDGDTFACCDTDILFLRPFTRLFELPSEETGCVFMQDWQEAYALRPWHLAPGSGLDVPRRLNCGLFVVRRRHYDLDFLEWLLGRDYAVFGRLPWLEQTCWGALAWRANGRYWDERQFCVARPGRSLPAEIVGAHFTSSVRGELEGALQHVRHDGSPVLVRTVPMARLNAVHLAADQVRRFIRTRVTERV